jgi:HEAT repeat protein
VSKREWGKCIEIGAPAVNPLIVALTDWNSEVYTAAANTLVQIGTPAITPLIASLPLIRDSNSIKFHYALVTLEKIGNAQAVKPLIAYLEDGDWGVRQVAANCLVRLYQSNLLDSSNKKLIVAHRARISSDHSDKNTHSSSYDGPRDDDRSSHTDTSEHTDNGGIGVIFPL